jgi:hypothetical protein
MFSLKLKGLVKFIVLFMLFTLLFYQVISFFASYFETHQPKVPSENVVPVLAQEGSGTLMEQVKERLQIFYWLGE